PQFFVCNRVGLWLKSSWREREDNTIPGGAALLDFAEAEFCAMNLRVGQASCPVRSCRSRLAGSLAQPKQPTAGNAEALTVPGFQPKVREDYFAITESTNQPRNRMLS